MTNTQRVSDLLEQWSNTTLSDKEIPLGDVLESIKAKDGRFVLKRSKQYSSSCVLWDTDNDEVAAITHAFVVRYASHIQTGNFVPEGKLLPEGMMDYLRKSEPGNMAQISLTFDVRMDDELLVMINVAKATLEDWVLVQPEFDPGQRPRNPWMSPTYIANNMKFTVTSQLFRSKNAFNCKDGVYKVDYPVHPWIAESTVPHNPLWIPNPDVVQFYELRNDKLYLMQHGKDPEVHPGDVIKLVSKLVVTSGRDTWNSSFIPWQALRVGRLDKVDIGPSIQMEDHRPTHLLRDGDTITMGRRKDLKAAAGEAKPRREEKVFGDESSELSGEDSGRDPSHVSSDLEYVDGPDLKEDESHSKPNNASKVGVLGKRKHEEVFEPKKRTLKPRSTRNH